MPGRTRVVVVDDHRIMAGSLTGPLAARPDIDVDALGFDEALARTDAWNRVDVALLDAADPGDKLDQYPGVRLARHIRLHAGSTTTIAVITNRFTDDALRARLVAWGNRGADFCFDRDDLRDPDELYRFVVAPAAHRVPLPAPDEEWLRARGISRRSDIEAIIELAGTDDVLRPGSFVSRGPGERRRLDRLLGQLNDLGFGRPERRDRKPTVEQVRTFLRDVLGHR